jgi:DNA-binding transcriptional LysR family regulator
MPPRGRPRKHRDGAKGPGDVHDIWLGAIETFTRVYTTLMGMGGKYESHGALFRAALPGVGNSTIVQRLGRVAAVFCRGSGEPEWSDFELLFEFAGGTVRATDAAERLFDYLQSVQDVCNGAREATKPRGELPFVPQVVRLGIPQTVGLYILSSALSGWGRLFPPDWVAFEVQVDSTRVLIDHVAAGALDCMIGYGGAKEVFLDATLDPRITFRDLEYDTQSVLITHPEHELVLRPGLTSGGRPVGRLSYRPGELRVITKYEDIPPDKVVDFSDIDPRAQSLIVVPAFGQPPQQRTDFLAWRDRGGRIILVDTYDEALSLVRMGQGITVAFEVYAGRALVAPYKLGKRVPLDSERNRTGPGAAGAPTFRDANDGEYAVAPEENAYRRHIGQYYRKDSAATGGEGAPKPKPGRARHTMLILSFIEEYFRRFKARVRTGDRPALFRPGPPADSPRCYQENPEYLEFLAQFVRTPLCREVIEEHVRRLDMRLAGGRPEVELPPPERRVTIAECEAVRMIDAGEADQLNCRTTAPDLDANLCFLFNFTPESLGKAREWSRAK